MSGFDKTAALALIEEYRRLDAAAAAEVSSMPGVDRAMIAQRMELRQSILAVVAAAIENGMDEAQAFDAACGTGMHLLGSALRLRENGRVRRPVFTLLASTVIDHLATAAGVDVVVADLEATGRSSAVPAAAPTAPTNTRH